MPDAHGGRTHSIEGRVVIFAKHALARYRERSDDPSCAALPARIEKARWSPRPPAYFISRKDYRPLQEAGFVIMRGVGVLPVSIEVDGGSGEACLLATTFVAAP